MKVVRTLLLGLFALTSLSAFAFDSEVADSVYLFSYGNRDGGRGGLHLAWSGDKHYWHTIGSEHSWVRCDYGRWGAEKRMLNPFLMQTKEGMWRLIWSLNERDGAIASTSSPDLINWFRQHYEFISPNKNVLGLSALYDIQSNSYHLTWCSDTEGKEQYFSTTTPDFKTYTPAVALSTPVKASIYTAVINGKEEQGQLHRVAWTVVDGLLNHQRATAYREQLHRETISSMAPRFKDLKPLTANLKVDLNNSKKISDVQMGAFFEDINYAADGGIYAELIQNRDFEYNLSDKEGHDLNWNATHSWVVQGEGMDISIETNNPIHTNNANHAVLTVDKKGAKLVNSGWGGIPLIQGDRYLLSLFLKHYEGKTGSVQIRLVAKDGSVIAETALKLRSSGKWEKISTLLTARSSVNDAVLEIIPQTPGRFAIDFVSLFPEKTYKGRKNGLRADLAQTIADIRPRFVRFPGGCVAHGDGIDNIYNWKYTVGPLEARKPLRNLWGYHQTMGLGYFEYFQWCEDMGAHPLPVIAAGVPCQNSAHSHKYGQGGQMGGVPMCDMDQYIQDILDLIEWANGDPKTSKWAKMRADAGHPKPFGLKYLGIGNEDLITDVFEERFEMIVKSVKSKYPNIEIIGTAGPFWFGSDYEEGWKIGKRLNIAMLDEHYYNTPGWFVNNQDYYDKYNRNNPKVYLGEYAAHVNGRHSNIETALSEAIYLLSCERNGDVVEMTSYAPLLAKEGFTQWTPDLIYFNNTEVKPTVNYQVQKLFGNNAGDTYLYSQLALDNSRQEVINRVKASVVKDSKEGDIILKLVNLLPIETSITTELVGLNATHSSNALRSVLAGLPDDKQTLPVTGQLKISSSFSCKLPPYSLTVIRIPSLEMKKK